MQPNMWANELGMMPFISGIERTPSIVKVLPVPVWPYAKIVPVCGDNKHKLGGTANVNVI